MRNGTAVARIRFAHEFKNGLFWDGFVAGVVRKATPDDAGNQPVDGRAIVPAPGGFEGIRLVGTYGGGRRYAEFREVLCPVADAAAAQFGRFAANLFFRERTGEDRRQDREMPAVGDDPIEVVVGIPEAFFILSGTRGP